MSNIAKHLKTLWGKATVTVLGGKGSAAFKDGVLTTEIPETLQFLFPRVSVDGE